MRFSPVPGSSIMALIMKRAVNRLAPAIRIVGLSIMLVFLTGICNTVLAREQTGAAPRPKGKTAAASKSGPEVVTIGAYLNDVQAIDLKNHNYMVDFYLWFRWQNPDIDPSNTLEFVNHSESWGTTITKVYENPEVLPDGQRYQVIHVEGRMSRKLDLRNYPFDKQGITIEMEDTLRNVFAQKFKVDAVSANPELKLPGFQYKAPGMYEKEYTHPTNFGDVRVDKGDTYSRVFIELHIARPTVNAVVKNVLPVLLTVVCCSFVFLLHPSFLDTRFQIAIFSIFSIIALQITASGDLPTIEYLTILDTLFLFAYVYCIVVIALLVYVAKLSRDETRMEATVKFDRWSGGLLFGVYLVASALVIFSALTT